MSDYASRSAEIVVPLLTDLIRPKSVIDVGCGLAAWLKVFQQHGVEAIYGMDGDYVRRDMLQIPEELFVPADLTQPFRFNRRFDLVVSLEVAEHLPADVAGQFVESLCSLGDTVLFSAAIPYQGGESHVNEQWPAYWTSLFRNNGYQALDCIRPVLWNNERVDWWYSQNIILYVRGGDAVASLRTLPQFPLDDAAPYPLVHPRCNFNIVETYQLDVANLVVRKLRNIMPTFMRRPVGRLIRSMIH